MAGTSLITAPPILHPGFISGRWYMPYGAVGSAGSVIPTGAILLQAFLMPRAVSVSKLGARLTVLAASGNMRLALYANNPVTGRPTGEALVATGNISTAATGTVEGAVTPATIPAGGYWAAVQVDATAGGVAAAQAQIVSSVPGSYLIGSTTQANVTTSAGGASLTLSVTQAFGAFPDMTSATFVETSGNATAIVNHLVA